MARIARVVVPGIPHHITQRGNRRQPTFLQLEDYQYYLRLMSEWCGKLGVEIWAYCLMTNHVHLIAVPKKTDSLRLAIGEMHKRYTRYINFREGWRGHLWQGRFCSCALDEKHLVHAVRYIEQNPIRAGICRQAAEYQWSSASAYLIGQSDQYVNVKPVLELVGNWQEQNSAVSEEMQGSIRKHEKTGRPLGDLAFVQKIEIMVKRKLVLKKTGPKKKKSSGKII